MDETIPRRHHRPLTMRASQLGLLQAMSGMTGPFSGTILLCPVPLIDIHIGSTMICTTGSRVEA